MTEQQDTVSYEEVKSKYMPVKEAAELLGVKPNTLRSQVMNKGEFRAVKTRMGRIEVLREDIERALENYGTPITPDSSPDEGELDQPEEQATGDPAGFRAEEPDTAGEPVNQQGEQD